MLDDALLDSVAVVGLSCRLPGARNTEELWRNLAEGVESVTRFSDEDLVAAGVDPETLADPAYVRAGAVLDDVDLFDAELFGFTPREAELMDPQQRLFLECSWAALEDAGHDPRSSGVRVGVYAGARLDTYWMGFASGRQTVHDEDALPLLLGNDKDHLALQVSHRLDLRGPSIGVQTACSTSLAAVSMACQALLGHQCDLALAGGVTVRVPQTSGYLHRPGGIGSPDGHCRAFSADARGSVFGSGLGVVVLRRLDDALADGDRVRAVVRGTAINNDGALKVGYTAPSEEGQAEVIALAQAIAGVSPDSIGYVEAHGTGTPLGDSIEVAALTRAFRAGTSRTGFCALGSLETNIGHLDCAAGVAGLIKTVLAVERGWIPPSLHFRVPNPDIDFAGSPFFVNSELRQWPIEGPRRAGVSSFGIGGTNVHAVLEQAPESDPPGPARPWHLLPLSGRTPSALEAVARNLAAHLRAHPELPIAEVAYTLQVGRRPLRHRRIVVCRAAAEAIAALESSGADRPATVRDGVEARRDCPVVFLFPGGVDPSLDAAAVLYRHEPAFREGIDRVAEAAGAPGDGEGLPEILLPPAGASDATALFAVEYALAGLWTAWTGPPRALAGEGVGELVAACVAGVLSLKEGVDLAARFGRPGAAAPRLRPAPPEIPLLSSRSGTWLTAAEAADPGRWTGALAADRFPEGVAEMTSGSVQAFLEVGPGRTLLDRVAARVESPDEAGRQPVLVASLSESSHQTLDAPGRLLDALGRLWIAGVPADWSAFHAGSRRLRVPLPTYPFEGRRYWIDDLKERPAPPTPARAAASSVPSVPAESNGHLRREEPAPRPDLQVPFASPGTATERAVTDLWQRLLGVAPIGIDDDFFALGGHSLLAVRVAGALRAELGVDVPASVLFHAPTVTGLAAWIDTARSGTARDSGGPDTEERIEPIPRDGELPLSFAQERHWFLARMDPDSPLFNHCAGLVLEGRLDVPVFARALDAVIARHEAFRAAFLTVGGRPVQRIEPPGRYPPARVDLSGLPAGRREGEASRLGRAVARRPFDLARPPLLRALLARLAEREHHGFFVLHHIVGDQWSAGVLVRELTVLYTAFAAGLPSPLPEMPIQYADFAAWQRRRLEGGLLESELAYWRERLAGRPAALDLPADRPRSAAVSAAGASAPFELSPGLSERVRELARHRGATPFMVLLAAYQTLLHRLTGALDVVVGAPVAGRDRPEADGLIGCFINAVALRTELSGDPSFAELVGRVREVTLGAYAHQELPFEKLVAILEPERQAGRSPIFQVVFNYQNAAPSAPADLPGLAVRRLAVERGSAKYDLTLYMWEAPDRLAGAFEYRTGLFDAGRVARWREELEALLERAVAAPEIRLSALVATLGAQETERRIMRQDEMSHSNLKKLKITRRRAVNLAQQDLVRTELLDGRPLPLVMMPNVDDVDLTAWAEKNPERLEKELLVHGGILFRGFSVPTAEAFERFVNAVTPDLVNYVEGSSPRVMVGDKVYTSTEYPPEYFVSMHNELSYAHKWPSKIFFYCDTEPAEGGETPIADSREVWRRIDPEVRGRFEEKGLVYTRNLHGDTGAGLSWQTVFETDDRATVEAYCREGGIEYRWTGDGGLKTRQSRPATIKHPKTGEWVWFNQVDQWHPSNLGDDLAAALRATTQEEDLPINACFADGTPLDPADLEHVRQVFEDTLVAFPWRKGDVLLLDNTLTAHGRMPFKPPRRVLVAMGGGTVRLDEIEA